MDKQKEDIVPPARPPNTGEQEAIAVLDWLSGYKETKEKPVKKKPGKYGNQKVVFDGMEFDSKKEAATYYDLKMMVLSKEITNLRRQVVYNLNVEDTKIASYIADFVYIKNGIQIVEDVKSNYTRKLRPYCLKKKLMKAIHNIEILET